MPARKVTHRVKYSEDQVRFSWAERLNSIAVRKVQIDQVAAKMTLVQMEAAIQNLTAGNGTSRDIALLAGEASIARRMCLMDFAGAKEHLPTVNAAFKAMQAAGERHLKLGKWGLDGEALMALRELVDLREALLTHEDNRIGIEQQAYNDAHADAERGEGVLFFRVVEGRETATC